MDTIELAIAIRAYSERPDREPVSAKPQKADAEAPRWTLVFDCETATDSTQQLRFGFYQVRDGDELHGEGLFYDPNALSKRDVGLVRRYAESRHLELITVEEFRTEVYVKFAYTRGGQSSALTSRSISHGSPSTMAPRVITCTAASAFT